jgi:hypothetical protein
MGFMVINEYLWKRMGTLMGKYIVDCGMNGDW